MADDLGIGNGIVLTWHRHGLGLTDLGVATVATTTATSFSFHILLESGDSLLKESGEFLLLEENDALLLEDGFTLLTEAGDRLVAG